MAQILSSSMDCVIPDLSVQYKMIKALQQQLLCLQLILEMLGAKSQPLYGACDFGPGQLTLHYPEAQCDLDYTGSLAGPSGGRGF